MAEAVHALEKVCRLVMTLKFKHLTVQYSQIEIPSFDLPKEMSSEFIIDVERLCQTASHTAIKAIIIAKSCTDTLEIHTCTSPAEKLFIEFRLLYATRASTDRFPHPNCIL